MKEQLVVETLTSNEENKIAIQSFVASKKGKALERYLKKSAWKEDIDGNTKVYLVKDKPTYVPVAVSLMSTSRIK